MKKVNTEIKWSHLLLRSENDFAEFLLKCVYN
jgi:hypothetical protein